MKVRFACAAAAALLMSACSTVGAVHSRKSELPYYDRLLDLRHAVADGLSRRDLTPQRYFATSATLDFAQVELDQGALRAAAAAMDSVQMALESKP